MVSVDRDANNNILMTTCSNSSTIYGNMSIYTPPTLNTIWAEEGKLLFKDNHAELPMWGMWHYESYRDGDGSKSSQIDFWLYLNLDGDKINGFHTLTYQASAESAEIVDASSLKYLDKTIYGVLRDSVAQITIKSKYNDDIPPIKAEIKYLNVDSIAFRLTDEMAGIEHYIPRNVVLKHSSTQNRLYYSRNLSELPLEGRWVQLSVNKDGDTIRSIGLGTEERYIDFNLKEMVVDHFTGHESSYYNILRAYSDRHGTQYSFLMESGSVEFYPCIEIISDTLIRYYHSSHQDEIGVLFTSTPNRYRISKWLK